MRNTARYVLVTVVLMFAAALLPRAASQVVAPDAHAQIVPTPTIPNLIKETPEPEPTQDPDEDPIPTGDDDDGDGGGGTGGGGDGDGGTSGGGGGDGDGSGDGGKKDGSRQEGGGKNDGLDGRGGGRGGKRGGRGGVDPSSVPSIAGRIPGAYDTNKLVAVAARLRSLGMSAEEVVRKVYPPFIIAGPSSWIDTWHAPRYGPAPGQVRVHEGQDVFCDYGDPVLAPTDGTTSFSDGGLGGITARVHMANGEYWYMTHLSDLNRNLTSGQFVKAGTVVGYCGTSGNAAGTSPHVHFGWYQEGGVNPRNPMKHLINWLRTAERRVLGVEAKTTKERQRQYASGALTAARRFGDAFAPDRSSVRLSGESLYASGSSPAKGALGVASAALQEALAKTRTEFGYLPTFDGAVLHQHDHSDEGGLDPASMLSRLLEEASSPETESGD